MHTVSIYPVSWYTSPIMLEPSASIFFTKTVSKESCDKFHEEEMLHNVWHTTPQNDTVFLKVVSAQQKQIRLPLCLSTKFKYDNQVQSYAYQSMNTILSRFQYVQCPYRKMLPSHKEKTIKKIKTIITMYNYKLDTSWTLFLEHEVAISNGLSTTS